MMRVTEELPCPVCGKPDWCLISEDGKVVICPRTPSEKKIGDSGWLHFREKGCGWKTIKEIKALHKKKDYPINWDVLNKYYQSMLKGVVTEADKRLGVGYDGEAFTYPMYNADGNIIGIQRRKSEGKKKYSFCKGSKNGCFIPTGIRNSCTLFVCEGLSDTYTAVKMGLNAIGRASCGTCTEIIIKLAKKYGIPVVYIIADNDKPGLSGANNLCIALHNEGIKAHIIVAPVEDLKETCLKYGLDTVKEEIRKWVNIYGGYDIPSGNDKQV